MSGEWGVCESMRVGAEQSPAHQRETQDPLLADFPPGGFPMPPCAAAEAFPAPAVCYRTDRAPHWIRRRLNRWRSRPAPRPLARLGEGGDWARGSPAREGCVRLRAHACLRNDIPRTCASVSLRSPGPRPRQVLPSALVGAAGRARCEGGSRAQQAVRFRVSGAAERAFRCSSARWTRSGPLRAPHARSCRTFHTSGSHCAARKPMLVCHYSSSVAPFTKSASAPGAVYLGLGRQLQRG